MAPLPMKIKTEAVDAVDGTGIVQSIEVPTLQIKKEDTPMQPQGLYSIPGFKAEGDADASQNSDSKGFSTQDANVEITIYEIGIDDEEVQDRMADPIPLLSPNAIGAELYRTASESHPAKLCGLSRGPNGSVEGRIVTASCFGENGLSSVKFPRLRSTSTSPRLSGTPSN